MSQLQTWLTSPFTINQSYVYHGSRHELDAQIRELSNSKMIEENYYCIEATVSIGTMMTTGAARLIETAIRIHMKISPAGESLQRINIYTKVRPENWLLLMVFIIILVGVGMQAETPLMYIEAIGILSGGLLLINFIYKVQEWILLYGVVKKLKLAEKKHEA